MTGRRASRTTARSRGVFTDYHYYGTGDIGGTPDEDSVKRLEAIVTKGSASLPPLGDSFSRRMPHPEWPEVKVGDGPVHVISAGPTRCFSTSRPPKKPGCRTTPGEMELTNHSAGSLTSRGVSEALDSQRTSCLPMQPRSHPLRPSGWARGLIRSSD